MKQIKNISINGKEVRSLACVGGGIIYSKSMGYEELEYIQGDSNQYIDTGVHLVYGHRYEMTFMWDLTASLENKMLGACDGSYPLNDNIAWPRHRYNNRDVGAYIYEHEVTISPTIACGDSIGRWYSTTFCIINNGDVTLTDLESQNIYTGNVGYLPEDWESGSTAYLFRNSSTINVNKSAGKIAYLKIWDADDTLVADIRPARRLSDNAVGAYDTVRGVFLENCGTGAFLAGEPTGRYY